MAGCDTRNFEGQGDYSWSKGRVTTWFAVGGMLGAVGTAVVVALALGAGPVGFLAGLATLGAVILGGLAAGLLSMFIGYGVEWFTRLKTQNPSEITFVGFVLCAGRNLGNPGPPAFCDGDWTFNISPRLQGMPTDPMKTWAVTAPGGLTVDEVRTRTAPGAEFAGRVYDPDNLDSDGTTRIDILHTEIGSRIGDYAAVGGMIGAVAGLAGGIIAGVVACVALGILTFGLALAVCALIIAACAAAGTALGGAVGQWAGGGIGALVDWADDFDEAGEAIQEGCFVSLTGEWVTDRSHQHNEIHDISSFQIMDCGVGAVSTPLETAGAVGIGRHPIGPDP